MWAEYYATLKSQKSAQFVMAQKPNSERITTKLAYVFGLHKDKSNPFRDLEASNHYNVAINLLMPLQNGSQNETTIAAFESHICLVPAVKKWANDFLHDASLKNTTQSGHKLTLILFKKKEMSDYYFILLKNSES